MLLRFLLLPTGIQLGSVILLLAATVTGAAMLGHGIDRFRKRGAPPDEPPPRSTWGLKAFILFLAVIIPFGVTALAAVAAGMGRAHWRRDAAVLVATSLPFALLLFWQASSYFPYAGLRDHLAVSAVLGLTFGVFQLWAMVKLLRQYWAEPLAQVPLCPPLAWFMQAAMLGGFAFYLAG